MMRLAVYMPIWIVLTPVAQAADLIPPAEQRRLDLAATDYLAGKAQPALAFFSSVASNAKPAKVEAIDRSLGEKKLPPLGKLLAQERLAALHEGMLARLPRPHSQVILLELPTLVGYLDDEKSVVRTHPLLNEPLPVGATLLEYERLLDSASGLTDNLAEIKQVADDLAGLVKYIPSAERADLVAPLDKMAQRDYRAEAAAVEELSRRLAGIDAALRVRRLQRALDVLSGKGPRAERLLAAHTWQEDSARLTAFFKAFKAGLKLADAGALAELDDPGLPDRIRSQADKCRGLAGRLTATVNELDAAIFWWRRGRYGKGPEMFGLAKPESASVSVEAARDLYMPDAPPHPTDPAALASDETMPQYARRHFHWWAWENQQLASGQVIGMSGLADHNLVVKAYYFDAPVFTGFSWHRAWASTRGTWLPDFQMARFTYFDYDDEPVKQGVNLKILSRLVGYLEYEQSLDHFQRFLRMALPEEIAAADEWVRERGDLAVYTNLSRFVEPADSVLAEKPSGDDDLFERRGMEWLIALARVEHQAALVGFTASRSPLTAELPATGGRTAYQELLADGAKMHYWAWRRAREKVKRDELRGGDLVSEARRVVLAVEFTKAAISAASAEEVGQWQQRQHELEQDLERLVPRIRDDSEQRKVAQIDAPRLLFGDGGGARKGRRDDDDRGDLFPDDDD